MYKKKQRFWSICLLLVLVLFLFIVSSCTKTADITAPTVTPENSPPPTYSPTIPGAGAYIITDDGTLTNEVNFGVNSPGYYLALDWGGDIVYYLDVEPPFTAGQSALTAEGTYQHSVETSVLWKNLAPGMHSFSAQLVKLDLTPLDPYVAANVQLEISSSAVDQPLIQSLSVQMLCRPGFYPPDMPGMPQGASACAEINISTDIRNFKVFSDKIGQSAMPGEGHFIYYFNVSPPTTPGKPALTEEGTYAITADSIASWLSVLPGEYKVWVQLVNNDNTPLEPPVIAGGTITVPFDANRYN
jgi:hypothetical protein